MSSSALRLVLLSAMIAGCGGSDGVEPDPLPVQDDTRGAATRSPTPSGSSASSASIPSSAPSGSASAGSSGPRSRHWKGTLQATSPRTFGGGGYCDYRITLQQIQVDLLEVDGDIVSGNVTATAVEELASPCGDATPIPANAHTYVLASSSTLPSGLRHLELSPMAANRPQATLVVEGELTGVAPSLSFAWHRIDVGSPLDWRVSAAITVAAP